MYVNFQDQRSTDMEVNLETMAQNCALSDTEKEQLLLNASNHQKSPISPPMNNGGVSKKMAYILVLHFTTYVCSMFISVNFFFC